MPSPSYVPVIATGRDVTFKAVTASVDAGADIALAIETSGDAEATFAVDGGGKLLFSNGTDAPDAAIRRAGAGLVITEGAFGVGNSAAAATPGTVVAKIEIFDAAGASLGFLPVYDAIT